MNLLDRLRVLVKGRTMTPDELTRAAEREAHRREMEEARRAQDEATDRMMRMEVLQRSIAPKLARMKDR